MTKNIDETSIDENQTQGHCHSGACGCAGLADDGDEFYEFSDEQVTQKPLEKPHPKNDAELAEILANIPEVGGLKSGAEPTKHGDWAHNGKAVDF
jgi:hypothetical protein